MWFKGSRIMANKDQMKYSMAETLY